jgi:4-amino-4-deoxy-L-arabinose transferase-like glycosyltransferase
MTPFHISAIPTPETARTKPGRRSRLSVRERRPPGALISLLVATALLGTVWALLTPAFQAPDENAHFAYVQSLGERGELPGAADRQFQSTEQLAASDAVNSDQTAQQLIVKPEWSRRRHDDWLSRSDVLSAEQREDGGGPNPATPNPPLYYLWEVLPYKLASGGDLFARLSAMRLAAIPFLLVTVTATWLLAGVVFGPRRGLQLAAASVPALAPMVTFVSMSVSPDTLLYALWSLALWLGARMIRGRGGALDVALLVAVAALAVVTKATSYALLPAILVALVISAWRTGGGTRRWLVTALVAGATFAVVAGPWYLAARLDERPAAGQLAGAAPAEDVNVREFGSYVWQYYLPRLPFQAPYGALYADPQAYETWFKQGWAAFGWLETRWPGYVYAVLALFCAAIGIAALLALIRRRRSIDLGLLAFFGAAFVCLMVGLHLNEYRLAEAGGTLTNQGRYLFPLVSLAGLGVAAALIDLPARLRAVGLGAIVGGLFVVQLFAIALVAARFYA